MPGALTLAISTFSPGSLTGSGAEGSYCNSFPNSASNEKEDVFSEEKQMWSHLVNLSEGYMCVYCTILTFW